MAIGVPYLVGSESTKTSTTTSAITLTTAIPANDTIIVFAGSPSSATTLSVADTGGNTYTAGPLVASVNPSGQLFTAPASTALAIGDTITVTWSASVGTHAAAAYGVSGVNAVDVQNQASGTGSTYSIPSGGATTQADTLIFAGYVRRRDASNGAPTVGTGFTVVGSQQGTTGSTDSTNVSTWAEYKILAATGSSAASASNVSINWAGFMVALKGGSYSSPGYLPASGPAIETTGATAATFLAGGSIVSTGPAAATTGAIAATLSGRATLAASGAAIETASATAATFKAGARLIASGAAATSAASVAGTLSGRASLVASGAAVETVSAQPGILIGGSGAILAASGPVILTTGAVSAVFRAGATIAAGPVIVTVAGIAGSLSGSARLSALPASLTVDALPVSWTGAATLASGSIALTMDVPPALLVAPGYLIASGPAAMSLAALPAFVTARGGLVASGPVALTVDARSGELVIVQLIAIGGVLRYQIPPLIVYRTEHRAPMVQRQEVPPQVLVQRVPGRRGGVLREEL